MNGGRAIVTGIRMGKKTVMTGAHSVKVRSKNEVFYPVVQCEIHGIEGQSSASYFVVPVDIVYDEKGTLLGDGCLWPKVQFNQIDGVQPLGRVFSEEQHKSIKHQLEMREASIKCGNGEPKKEKLASTKRKVDDDSSEDSGAETEQRTEAVVTRGKTAVGGGGSGHSGRGGNKKRKVGISLSAALIRVCQCRLSLERRTILGWRRIRPSSSTTHCWPCRQCPSFRRLRPRASYLHRLADLQHVCPRVRPL